MAESIMRIYLKREFEVVLMLRLLRCACILVLGLILYFNLMNIELITASREVIKIGKGFVGWLTCLHNLCMGRSEWVALLVWR
jgi:hypothetical protein